MSHAEDTLYRLLDDTESIEYLFAEGFHSDTAAHVIPSDIGRKIVKWCVEEFYRSGRRRAPSREAIRERWADELESAEIELGDGTETDTIEIVVDQLRTHNMMWRSQKLFESSMTDLQQADPTDKIDVLGDVARRWDALHRSVQPRRKQQSAFEGIEDSIVRYFSRSESGVSTDGLLFGLPLLDEHLSGVHPGELVCWAGETGAGKSWIANYTVWRDFLRGRKVVLFTLENDLPMTFDRIICMGARVNYERYQAGKCTEEELKRIGRLADKAENAPNAFVVEMPRRGERTVHDMVRKAIALGADTIIIDQLTFIESVGKYNKKNDAIYEIMHDLKELISEGSEKISGMVLHQINREGAEHARKNGSYLATHMSYGSEVERTVDFLIAIYQSEMDRRNEDAQFQLIKSRRTRKARWAANFRLGAGDIRIMHVINEDAEPEADGKPESPRGPQPAADDDDLLSVEEALSL